LHSLPTLNLNARINTKQGVYASRRIKDFISKMQRGKVKILIIIIYYYLNCLSSLNSTNLLCLNTAPHTPRRGTKNARKSLESPPPGDLGGFAELTG